MNFNILIPIFHQIKNILFDDEFENEEDSTNILEKVENFCEFTVPNMTSKQFQLHFRMSPRTFENVLLFMHNVYVTNGLKTGYTRTSIEKELMVTVWYLSNIESFRSVADRFGLSKSTCWDILYRTSSLVLAVNKKYKIISWPDRNQQEVISRQFNTHGFAGIIGCIDGSHIPIPAPKEHHISYINRKNFHSVLLQGVCDHKLLFTNVYAGEAGSLHDYTVYKRSDLFRGIRSNRIQFYDDNYLIGDLAYKLDANLIVGFKNTGHLTIRQKNFNILLSKHRVAIEQTFGLLKGRFRRLKMLETVRLDLICLLIVSACVLHNVCILNDDLPDNVNIEIEAQEERRNAPHNQLDIDIEEERNNAIHKRNNIMNTLQIINRN